MTEQFTGGNENELQTCDICGKDMPCEKVLELMVCTSCMDHVCSMLRRDQDMRGK